MKLFITINESVSSSRSWLSYSRNWFQWTAISYNSGATPAAQLFTGQISDTTTKWTSMQTTLRGRMYPYFNSTAQASGVIKYRLTNHLLNILLAPPQSHKQPAPEQNNEELIPTTTKNGIGWGCLAGLCSQRSIYRRYRWSWLSALRPAV